MRITNEQLFNRIIEFSNKSRAESTRLQDQIASGKRVTKPSDDAFAFGSGEALKQRIQQNEVFQENIDEGVFQATTVQNQLDDVLDQLFQLKSLATKGANEGALDQEEFDILAKEVEGIRETIVESLNIQANGRFLFSGTATQTEPFEISGTSVNFNGNSENLTVNVSDNRSVDISVSGDELASVFSTLENVQTALEAGDADAVRAELGSIDDTIDQVSRKTADIGRSINLLELSQEQIEQTNILNSGELSELTDSDLIEASSRLQQQQFAFQAALAANSRATQTSLLNFL